MTSYTSTRYSPILTDEVTALSRTPEARDLASRLVLERMNRTHHYLLDGERIGCGVGTSDGYVVSGRQGSRTWLVRVHHEGIPNFLAAAHLLGALER